MPLRTRLQSLIAALAAWSVVLSGVLVIDGIEQRRFQQAERALAMHQLGATRSRLETLINSRLSLSRSLSAFVTTRPDFSEEDFQLFARRLLADQTEVPALVLARGSVIAHVHPLEGNQDVLGIDLSTVDREREAVQRAFETGRTVVSGPIELDRRRRLFISHTPVRLQAPEPSPDDPASAEEGTSESLASILPIDPTNDAWGLALVVIDADRLFQEAGLRDSESGLKFALRDSADGGLHFFGDESLFTPEADSISLDVWQPSGYWTLAARPVAGWTGTAPGSIGWRLGGALLALFTGGFVFMLVRAPARLRGAVDEATAALSAAEEKFRGIFEHAHEGIYQSSPDGRFLSVNPAMARMYGFDSPEAMIAEVKDSGSLYAEPERRAEFRGRLERAGVVADFESEARRRDGSVMWVRESARVARDAGGRPLFYEGTVDDVTETKRAVEALQASQEALRARAESLRAINAMADALHRSLDMAQVADRALQLVREFLHAPVGSLYLHEEEEGSLRLASNRGRLPSGYPVGQRLPVAGSFTGTAVETRQIQFCTDIESAVRMLPEPKRALVEGGYRALLCIPLLHQDTVQGVISLVYERAPQLDAEARETLEAIGQTVGMAIANARQVERIRAEIAERERARAALAESEARYRAVSELTSDFAYAFRIGPDGRMRSEWATGAFQKITGYSIEEMDRIGWDRLVHPEDLPLTVDRGKRLLRLEPDVTELRIVTRDGQIRWLHDIARPTRDERTGEVVVYGAAHDLTEQKRAEQERAELEFRLRQAQKLEAIGTLAGGVAHDFNNLLTGILGYASVLKADSAPGTRVHKAADVIEKAAERASELTRQLLGFARRGKMQNVSVNVHDTALEVIALLKRTLDKRIRIHQRLVAPEPHVRGDPGQIQQVILNLAVNARDAMPDGGELLFSSDRVVIASDDSTWRGSGRPGEYLMIAVSDTGCGIPEELRDRVFEPFFTTKEQGKGTGMGLAMVYGIVENHGGFVTLDSATGKGTTVRVHLPVLREETSAPARPEAETPVPGTGRVLVVDDESVVRDLAADMLAALGYRVSTASGGAEAVDRYRDEPGGFDLVLLDMVMPGMGGKDTFLALRDLDPDVRVVLSTGYGRDGAAQEILDLGLAGFIQKPYRMVELSEVVARAIRPSAS